MYIFPDPSNTNSMPPINADILAPLNVLMERNRQQLSGMNPETVSLYGNDAKRMWWKHHKNADKELQEMLENTKNK